MAAKFVVGSKVKFLPGPRSPSKVTATVTGNTSDGKFLITKDAAGKERKVRPGSCTAA